MFINTCMHLVVNADFFFFLLSPGMVMSQSGMIIFSCGKYLCAVSEEIPPQNGAWPVYSNFLPRKMRERVILLRNYHMLFSESHSCAVQLKAWSVWERFLLMFFSSLICAFALWSYRYVCSILLLLAQNSDAYYGQVIEEFTQHSDILLRVHCCCQDFKMTSSQ